MYCWEMKANISNLLNVDTKLPQLLAQIQYTTLILCSENFGTLYRNLAFKRLINSKKNKTAIIVL